MEKMFVGANANGILVTPKVNRTRIKKIDFNKLVKLAQQDVMARAAVSGYPKLTASWQRPSPYVGEPPVPLYVSAEDLAEEYDDRIEADMRPEGCSYSAWRAEMDLDGSEWFEMLRDESLGNTQGAMHSAVRGQFLRNKGLSDNRIFGWDYERSLKPEYPTLMEWEDMAKDRYYAGKGLKEIPGWRPNPHALAEKANMDRVRRMDGVQDLLNMLSVWVRQGRGPKVKWFEKDQKWRFVDWQNISRLYNEDTWVPLAGKVVGCYKSRQEMQVETCTFEKVQYGSVRKGKLYLATQKVSVKPVTHEVVKIAQAEWVLDYAPIIQAAWNYIWWLRRQHLNREEGKYQRRWLVKMMIDGKPHKEMVEATYLPKYVQPQIVSTYTRGWYMYHWGRTWYGTHEDLAVKGAANLRSDKPVWLSEPQLHEVRDRFRALLTLHEVPQQDWPRFQEENKEFRLSTLEEELAWVKFQVGKGLPELACKGDEWLGSAPSNHYKWGSTHMYDGSTFNTKVVWRGYFQRPNGSWVRKLEEVEATVGKTLEKLEALFERESRLEQQIGYDRLKLQSETLGMDSGRMVHWTEPQVLADLDMLMAYRKKEEVLRAKEAEAAAALSVEDLEIAQDLFGDAMCEYLEMDEAAA
jgi:hypothetical protein